MVAFSTSPLLFLFLISISVASVSSALPNSTFQCHPQDYFALMILKKSFGNTSFFALWNKKTNCCNWQGIFCNYDANGNYDVKGRVTRLTIEGHFDAKNNNDANGIISSYIGDLKELKELVIRGNYGLKGRIPASIGNLKKLHLLMIAFSPLLTGPIPKTICDIPKLTELILNQNNLTGRLPGCLGARLTSINLNYNRLSGPIPEGFLSTRTTNASFEHFGVEKNNLTGAIPASMGNVNFRLIDLSANKFTDASVLFGEKKKALYIYMNYNELAFNFSKVVFPSTLDSFTMHHNKVYGSIPQQITKLKKLTYFDVRYNELCGPIPVGGSISKSSKYNDYFSHNKCLCGAPLKPCS